MENFSRGRPIASSTQSNPFIPLTREPQFSLSEAASKAGVTWIFVRNLVDNKTLRFDADLRRHKGRRKHRRFSTRDIELIRRVWQATRRPSIAEAAKSAERAVDDWPFQYWDGKPEVSQQKSMERSVS